MDVFNRLIGFLHCLVDRLFAFTKLLQNREVGWETVNRKDGTYQREMQPLWKKLKLLILFNPVMEVLDSTHLLRLWIHEKTISAGRREGTAKSATQIKNFVDFYGINMAEFEPSDIHAYHTFEDFFIRQHAPGSRPIYAEKDNTKAVVCADSRVVVYPTVDMTRALWIKGKNFTIDNLVLDTSWATKWKDGAVASFRLSPQDYHRYHSPVAGRIAWYKQISGDYYQVDPLCLQSDVDVLTRNARCCIAIQTKEFGCVLFVAIGATDVGSVQIRPEMEVAGTYVAKGEELGLFQFGGSSIIVAFEKDRIVFDEDLESVSRKKVMMAVEMGMSLGTAK